MYSESDLIPLSALQHYMFCPRQCALIHLEQIWEENRFTAEGRILHDHVDAGGMERRKNIKRVFGLPIRSLRLGLSGKADVVEFFRRQDGSWQPYPVEHKRGRRKTEDSDRVQLCAQALCLEEMLCSPVPEGALFYGKEQRREVVAIEEALRQETEEVSAAVHQMLKDFLTPSSEFDKKCKNCSLASVCLPRKVGGPRNRVGSYLKKILEEP
jgi:CRISPR-associated exonuclease Cas4